MLRLGFSCGYLIAGHVDCVPVTTRVLHLQACWEGGSFPLTLVALLETNRNLCRLNTGADFSMTYKSEFQLAVPIAQIEIGELRQSPQNVSAIAASLGECGLLHPITVSPLKEGQSDVSGTSTKYRLWAGRDRLLAAMAKGWKDIPALVIEADEAQLRIIAVQENFVRRKLTCLDESLLLNDWQTAYENRHPQARRGGDRRNRDEDQSANLAFCRYASERAAPRLFTFGKLGLSGLSLIFNYPVKAGALALTCLSPNPACPAGDQAMLLVALPPTRYLPIAEADNLPAAMP